MTDTRKFIIAAVGIFVCYFYFAILQEKITRGRYGDELQDDGSKGERFTYMLALVGVQCICNMVFAKGKSALFISAHAAWHGMAWSNDSVSAF